MTEDYRLNRLITFSKFPPMKHLISKEGFEKFKAEWEHLKYVERPAMINQVQAAAAEGDRSENAADLRHRKQYYTSLSFTASSSTAFSL